MDAHTSISSLETQSFMTKVYAWMAVALMVTAGVAFLTASSPTILDLVFSSRWTFYGLILGELGLVIFLSAMVKKLSAEMATVVFLLYAALNGLTFSVIFLVFTASSIASTFLTTSLTFAGMSLYGYTTKKDLTGIGSYLMMGLWGVIISSIVNLFLHNSTIDWVTSIIGLIVFVGLTAYDTQRIKNTNILGNSGTAEDHKESVMGALILYLDFINLFLEILRFTGKRK